MSFTDAYQSWTEERESREKFLCFMGIFIHQGAGTVQGQPSQELWMTLVQAVPSMMFCCPPGLEPSGQSQGLVRACQWSQLHSQGMNQVQGLDVGFKWGQKQAGSKAGLEARLL